MSLKDQFISMSEAQITQAINTANRMIGEGCNPLGKYYFLFPSDISSSCDEHVSLSKASDDNSNALNTFTLIELAKTPLPKARKMQTHSKPPPIFFAYLKKLVTAQNPLEARDYKLRALAALR